MNLKNQQALRCIQANAHLKEWNENMTLERKNRYLLDGKHKQERSRSLMEDFNLHERIALVDQQSQDIEKLIYQHSVVRIAIEERHRQEMVDLDQQLNEKPKPKFSFYAGVRYNQRH